MKLDEIEENQIKLLNNIKSKKEKGTYTEDFGMTAFRYVVDNQITSIVSENFRNKVIQIIIKIRMKSFKEVRNMRGFGYQTMDTMKSKISRWLSILLKQKIWFNNDFVYVRYSKGAGHGTIKLWSHSKRKEKK